jgi:hypothetical protein
VVLRAYFLYESILPDYVIEPQGLAFLIRPSKKSKVAYRARCYQSDVEI